MSSDSGSTILSYIQAYIKTLLSNDETTIADKLTALDTELTSAKTAVNDVSYDSILTDQVRMKSIVDAETDIIDRQISKTNTATQVRDRLIAQSISYKRRYQAYTSIIIVLMISIFICAGLFYVKKTLPNIPGIAEITMGGVIIVIAYDIIYLINQFIDISRRDRNNFDKIDPELVGLPTSGDIAALKTTYANSSNAGTCVGIDCCPAGNTNNTVWDSTNSRCIQKTT